MTLLLSLVALLPSAFASDCGDVDAPFSFTLSTCHAVCAKAASSITCQLSQTYDDYPADVYAVTDYGIASADYSIWGYDSEGDAFCCAYDDSTEVTHIGIYGTSLDDTLRAGNAAGTNWVADAGGMYSSMTVTINGYEGADTIVGSDDPSVRSNLIGQEGEDIIECNGSQDCIVHADEDDDTITCNALECELYGGEDDDTITCGAVCYAEGEQGSDTIIGSSVADEIWGGRAVNELSDLQDFISGGGGNDEIHGQLGNDVICGQGGDDLLYGDDGADTLSGGLGSSDVADGGNGSDACSGETRTKCESFPVFEPPPACP